MEQVGFSDFSVDSDGVLRRQLLAFHNESSSLSRCKSNKSFNLLVAEHYLDVEENIQTEVLTPKENCQIRFSNGASLTNLQANTGGYQGYFLRNDNPELTPPERSLSLFNGCQLLLNYRNRHESYRTFSAKEFLDDNFPIEDYKEDRRIILIGIDRSDGFGDNWSTPYEHEQVTPGVVMQAHMIEQIIDAASKKSLIWVLPRGVDFSLILVFAFIGGGLGWWALSLRDLVVIVVIVGSSMVVISLVVFNFNLWLPLMPHFLALSTTSSYVWWSNLRLKLNPSSNH